VQFVICRTIGLSVKIQKIGKVNVKRDSDAKGMTQ